MRVAVRNTAWHDTFPSRPSDETVATHLGATLGLHEDETTIAWRGINEISMTFDDDVDVAEGDLTVTGTASSYGIAGFRYNRDNHTATWTLSRGIDRDQVTIRISDRVQGSDGSGLTTTSTSHRESFEARMNVMPGDVNSDGKTNTQDVRAAISGIF